MSDRGPQFISQIWSGFLEKLRTSVSRTLGYHFQSNGQVERVNQEIGCAYAPFGHTTRMIGLVTYLGLSMHKILWGILLPTLFCFTVFWATNPSLFPWTANPTNAPAVDEWFKCSKEVWAQANRCLEQTTATNKQFANHHRQEAPTYRPSMAIHSRYQEHSGV